jgi:hypothetical protein
MRVLYVVVGFVAATVFILTTSTRPTAAIVIYPWCVNYGGGREGGAQNCGFTSRQQCELTRAGNGRLLRSEPLVSAVPTAADLGATHTPVVRSQ